jgi:hypothetical protein
MFKPVMKSTSPIMMITGNKQKCSLLLLLLLYCRSCCNDATASAGSPALSQCLQDKITNYLADTEHISANRASSSSNSSNKFTAPATCFGKPIQSTQALLAELDTFLATGRETTAGFITASCV